jgi:ABC-type multidrug transport system ATPase subunit
MEINDLQTTLSPSTIVYIPQRDVLHGFFTTRQYMLHYQALAGLPRDVDKVDKILEAFGLADHADVKIGDVFRKGLSGEVMRMHYTAFLHN